MFLSSGFTPNGDKFHQVCNEQIPSASSKTFVAQINPHGDWFVYRLDTMVKTIDRCSDESEAVSLMIKVFLDD